MLHLSLRDPLIPEDSPFAEELRQFGVLTVIGNGERLPVDERLAMIRNHRILITGWGSVPIPPEIACEPGRLEYVCNLTGGLRDWVPIDVIESPVRVTNWGDAPADSIAEGAMTLLLAVLKDLPAQGFRVRSGEWRPDETRMPGGTLKGLHVGIYGMGAIARRFTELILPFRPVLHVFDPYVTDLPGGCRRAGTLEELFDRSEAIVIHSGLSAETRGSVTADLLSRLPDGGIVVNTARGAIIDQEALFAELGSGRLRAGLDVLDGNDALESDHPARSWDNVLFTAHEIGRARWRRPDDLMTEARRICLENLRRFLANEPLRFLMDRDRYLRST